MSGLAKPVLIDLFRLRSDKEHRYDCALQTSGQICDTNLPVVYNDTQWSVLGEAHGYQHLMGVARAEVTQPSSLTWLQGERFNTWLTAASSGELVFAQLGANDPAFNLRRESTLILRQLGRNHLFASAFETHGLFHEPSERCFGARGVLRELRILGHDDQGSVLELIGTELHLLLMVSNRPDVKPDTVHELSFGGLSFRWTGYFSCQPPRQQNG
jgi:oligo-alginate lyase